MSFRATRIMSICLMIATLLCYDSNIFAATIFIHDELFFEKNLNNIVRQKSGIKEKEEGNNVGFSPYTILMKMLHTYCPLCGYKKCKKFTDYYLTPHYIDNFEDTTEHFEPRYLIDYLFKKIDAESEFIKQLTNKQITALKFVADILFTETRSFLSKQLIVSDAIVEIIELFRDKGHKIYLVSEYSSFFLDYYKVHSDHFMEKDKFKGLFDNILSLADNNVSAIKEENKEKWNYIQDDMDRMTNFLKVHKLEKDEITFIHNDNLSREAFGYKIKSMELKKDDIDLKILLEKCLELKLL